MDFKAPLVDPINLGFISKVAPTGGNLAWEYNPFRNYRLSESKYYFRKKFLSIEELFESLGIDKLKLLEEINKDLTNKYNSLEDYLKTQKNWDNFRVGSDYKDCIKNPITSSEEDPIFYAKDLLVDFETDELSFSINNPVDISAQYSYDGSVNLILNDGKNTPKLINSRFSPLGKNKYLIVDRKGDNDTNIYDLGSLFDTDTSLYKTYNGIPKILFLGVTSGGNLPIGNYHFYFRYIDADGNETDFVGESGLVSIFKGVTVQGIHTGFRNENSYKAVRFVIDNVDTGYQYLLVYYTRSTADIDLNPIVSAHKINQKFIVNDSSVCSIYITGNEDTSEISVDEINIKYLICLNVFTLALCQNMLFFGNIADYEINYTELADLSLRFTAKPCDDKDYNPVDHSYNILANNNYYDPTFIYNYVGYLNHEIYRFGIVYIMNNGQLSPVFNIRGMYFSNGGEKYSEIPIMNNGTRNYISYNENTGNIYNKDTLDNTDSKGLESTSLENVYGIVRIHTNNPEIKTIIGIEIGIDDKDTLVKELKKLKIKGYFFVRQKRIPLRLCLALTIGIDNESHTPLLYTDNSVVMNTSKPSSDNFYITERFLSDSRELTNDIEHRLYGVDESNVNTIGAICPEYDINSSYLNTIFCGDNYIIEQATLLLALKLDLIEPRHFYIEDTHASQGNVYVDSKIIGVEDNVKLVECDNKLFSARAGEAEEAFRYEYIEQEIKSSDVSNLLRGSYGPYLGISGYKIPGTIVNIYIKDIQTMSSLELFNIRSNDKSPYLAISERYSLSDGINTHQLYRGDSYICTFTHRLNRNFQDPSAPINDKIVDPQCWKNNYEVSDGVVKTENFDKINLGDINGIKLGLWVTFLLVSSFNLNIRSLNDSVVDEVALTGHARGFFPYYSMSAGGSYKIPEALCINKGFNKSLSERYNFELPNVPAIKNDFTNRISYSDIHINDAFKNGFRTFQGTHYRDYPKTYGLITKLVELRGNLICVFEHGVALIPINERAVAGEGSGGNIYINTSNVLPENPKIISDTFGSLWRESIIKTPLGIYGVDTIGKKIWRTNGENFECISDFKVQEFLNLNISLGEREIDPIIGIRNVKTHYNKFKHDIMFTFYDNLYGFEEKVWNLCYNELLLKWITFYSWVPSYSENIYNLYFSFDRNTSKWIAKLGVSNSGNNFSDGVCLSNNIIPNDAKGNSDIKIDDNYVQYKDSEGKISYGYKIGELSLCNRTLPDSNDEIVTNISYELARDNFGNWKKFGIGFEEKEEEGKTIRYYYLYLKVDAVDLCSELYVRGTKKYDGAGNIIYEPKISWEENQKEEWTKNCILNNNYIICKDDSGRRSYLSLEKIINPNIIYLLNIKANIKVTYTEETSDLAEAYTNGFKHGTEVDAGYYLSTVAVIPKYNMLFLTTDFWKHGLAGIIDIADKIYPTYWYGKLHPFEFEFVVADNPQLHKIFDNLEIISNNAEPESFHYEIIGDCYEFAKDKKNMYIRQEATKELYQYNGSDILFDSDYVKLDSEHRKRYMIQNGARIELQGYDKSTLFPLYYCRRNDFNNIEDYYHLKDGTSLSKDFSALSGAEIVRYDNLQEYRIWNHAKAINIADDTKGRIRGNMLYKEDKWCVLINPINLIQKNEPTWVDLDNQETDKIPVELNLNPLPDDILNPDKIDVPPSFEASGDSRGRGYTLWGWKESLNKEVKIKDKWVKIRVRYKGDKLAIITAIRTLYSASYA